MNQQKIYEAICKRGYGPDDNGLTPEQFAARQVAIPLFCAAEAIGVDLAEIALEKAQDDIERGKR